MPSNTVTVRRLSDEGVNKLSDWITSRADGPCPISLENPDHVVGEAVCEIDVSPLSDRYDLGKRVADAMGSEATLKALGDSRLWPAFTVAFAEEMVTTHKGDRNPGSLYRHVIPTQRGGGGVGRLAFRHLVRSAAEMVARFGDDAQPMLSVQPTVYTKGEEQIVSRLGLDNAFTRGPQFMKALNLMYAKGPKTMYRGAHKAAERMAIELRIKSRYHCLHMMTPGEIVRLLSDRHWEAPKKRALQKEKALS